MDQITTGIIGFLSSLPIWGIIAFFSTRSMRKRDEFEEKTSEQLTTLDKNLAIIAKDIEFASNVAKTVGELSERVSKIKYDIDNCFQKIRELQNVKET